MVRNDWMVAQVAQFYKDLRCKEDGRGEVLELDSSSISMHTFGRYSSLFTRPGKAKRGCWAP